MEKDDEALPYLGYAALHFLDYAQASAPMEYGENYAGKDKQASPHVGVAQGGGDICHHAVMIEKFHHHRMSDYQ